MFSSTFTDSLFNTVINRWQCRNFCFKQFIWKSPMLTKIAFPKMWLNKLSNKTLITAVVIAHTSLETERMVNISFNEIFMTKIIMKLHISVLLTEIKSFIAFRTTIFNKWHSNYHRLRWLCSSSTKLVADRLWFLIVDILLVELSSVEQIEQKFQPFWDSCGSIKHIGHLASLFNNVWHKCGNICSVL